MWDSFKNYIRQPFSADMSAFGWFLFIGLLIIIAIGWNAILSHITREV